MESSRVTCRVIRNSDDILDLFSDYPCGMANCNQSSTHICKYRFPDCGQPHSTKQYERVQKSIHPLYKKFHNDRLGYLVNST